MNNLSDEESGIMDHDLRLKTTKITFYTYIHTYTSLLSVAMYYCIYYVSIMFYRGW